MEEAIASGYDSTVIEEAEQAILNTQDRSSEVDEPRFGGEWGECSFGSAGICVEKGGPGGPGVR